MLIITTKDTKAGIFGGTSLTENKATAIRDFQQYIQNPNTKYGEDQDLYILGLYEPTTGIIQALKAPELLDKGVNYARGNNEKNTSK